MIKEEHPYLGVIVKPTYACNLLCHYCSVTENDTSKMTFKTVDKLFERVTTFCGTKKIIYLIWHGGEPLLMGPDFYTYIGKKTEEYEKFQILNSIQTNAINLNNEFIDVLIKYNFRFSTSIDGPPEFHDKFRKDKKGAGTFERVMKSISLLKSRGIPIGVVTVLNKMNKDALPDIYQFFDKAKIHLRINPVQLHGRAAANYTDVAISPREYGHAMIGLFDIWYNDPDIKIMLDPFCIIVGNIVTDVIHSCDFRRNCHAEIISVAPSGNVYPCGQFTGQDDYLLGNIYDESFNKIMESDKMKKLLMRVPENIERCSRCKYVEICNCGCTASAVCRVGDIMQPDFYCVGRKMLFQHIIDKIQDDLDRATRVADFISKES